jgi:uncharacterized protein YndB with AHSA1/START domain
MNQRELKLERTVEAPRDLLWMCWTEPRHLMPWFCPKPWTVSDCRIDLKPGGEFYTMMNSPEGGKFPNNGVFLEIVPGHKLVWTDAYTVGWMPTENPFFTAIVEFADAGAGKTKYTATARHWTVENAKKHAEMGFEGGWGTALEQLVEYTRSMK